MPLHLVSSSHHPETLSPARQALAKNHAAEHQIRSRLDSLDEIARQAQQAAERESATEQALDAVAEVEEAALRAWSTNASGPMPSPRTAEREQAIEALNKAHAESTAARRALGTIQPQVAALHAEYAALVEQRPALIAAVLVGFAEIEAAALRAAQREVEMRQTALQALERICTIHLHHPQLGADITLLTRRQRRELVSIDPRGIASGQLLTIVSDVSDEERARLKADKAALRNSYRMLAERLASDATAQIEET